MYKQIRNEITKNIEPCVQRFSDTAFIPFATDNTDYARFKKEILADEAQLQDADGNTMSAAAAKEYISTLP